MNSTVNRRFVLACRPDTLPDDSHFSIETVPVATPRSGELLVRVLLVALSPWQGQRLKDFRNYTTPFKIGELIDCDVLGEVIESQSNEIEKGSWVTGRLGWQEYAISRPENLTVVNREQDEAVWLSALSSPGLTAYCAMNMFGRPMPGQTLVVTSAAGSVGSYAVQLGKLSGMSVIGIAGSNPKCALVEGSLGADAAVNYQRDDFADRLKEVCRAGVDLVFDTVGGTVADAVFDNLNKYARVLIVGRTDSNNSNHPELDYVNMRQLWAREASIQCFSRYSYPREWSHARRSMQDLLEHGKIKPFDNIVEGFEQTPKALHDMLAGHYSGKVMVRYANAGHQNKRY